jgi:pre-mRNA-splicing factor 38A
MANATVPFAEAVHGTNPQYLVEKITRLKIHNSVYWKEHCFGLTAETIIDKAVMLKYCGGVYGGSNKPTNFLCLSLKLLQLQPDKDIIVEFIKNEDVSYSFISLLLFLIFLIFSSNICVCWALSICG